MCSQMDASFSPLKLTRVTEAHHKQKSNWLYKLQWTCTIMSCKKTYSVDKGVTTCDALVMAKINSMLSLSKARFKEPLSKLIR